jgi:predicted GNAT family N-acyltransferase
MSADRYDLRRVGEGATLADAHAVRRAVFIEEQGVPEMVELDGLDDRASHVVAYVREETDEKTGEGVAQADRPVGTARLRIKDGVAKPERVAVREEHRGAGLGRRLMDAIESIAREQGCDRASLHAQTSVEAFYHGLDYETTSGEFEQAGIPHVEMTKDL